MKTWIRPIATTLKYFKVCSAMLRYSRRGGITRLGKILTAGVGNSVVAGSRKAGWMSELLATAVSFERCAGGSHHRQAMTAEVMAMMTHLERANGRSGLPMMERHGSVHLCRCLCALSSHAKPSATCRFGARKNATLRGRNSATTLWQ